MKFSNLSKVPSYRFYDETSNVVLKGHWSLHLTPHMVQFLSEPTQSQWSNQVDSVSWKDLGHSKYL